MLQKLAKVYKNLCKLLQVFSISILLQPITLARSRCTELHIHNVGSGVVTSFSITSQSRLYHPA